jgi:hypothetical protein
MGELTESMMPRFQTFFEPTLDVRAAGGGIHPQFQLGGRDMNCMHCDHPLECVDQNRRSGTWLGSFICPNCRSEYFYAYRWGRLVRKS